MVSNEFLYGIGFGSRTREDTMLIFRTMYNKFINEGINDVVLGNLVYLRKMLDEHRELINNKTYNIITIKSILKKVKEYNICNVENYNIDVSNISPIPIDLVLEGEKEKTNDINNCTGIYGIYANNKLIYIGKTFDSFKKKI